MVSFPGIAWRQSARAGMWILISLLGAGALSAVALRRDEPINAMWIIVAAVCVYVVAYRFYSRFIAFKVLQLDDTRATPAERLEDGRDFVPTNKWILLGHHFAAIAGPGPLVGPTLAAQLGYLPGTLWLIIGAVLGGCVQDFVILFASMRRNGKSLGQIAKEESRSRRRLYRAVRDYLDPGDPAGRDCAGGYECSQGKPLGDLHAGDDNTDRAADGNLSALPAPGQSSGDLSHGIRAGHGGCRRRPICGSSALAGRDLFTFDARHLAWMIIAYGFAASVLPVWLLLAPRDYLSTFIKLGTILLLALGILAVRPTLAMPALSRFIDGTGPVFSGKIFPFAFITIACGAISGFHALDLLRHDSEADHQGRAGAADRLWLDAYGIVCRNHGHDCGLRPSAGNLLRHQQPCRNCRNGSGCGNGHDLLLGIPGNSGGYAAIDRACGRADHVFPDGRSAFSRSRHGAYLCPDSRRAHLHGDLVSLRHHV